MITNGAAEVRIFYPTLTRTINYFSCSPLFFFFFFFFLNKLLEVPRYARMQFHMMASLDDHVREFQ